ncbi:hypothetical protein PCANB_002726 [Pneumocystis canis]|nr:hypothetical protein PCK1_002799 [Pneumocystis canis]KAG5438620.1 hypothetical protein PCANB_002726 [Pneumocystis canis]
MGSEAEHVKPPDIKDRTGADTLVLFDVDGTLTPSRDIVSREMFNLLLQLRKKVVIGFVGGSNLEKQQEQLGLDGVSVIDMFDYAFPENGLIAYEQGKILERQSFIHWLGEEKHKTFVNFCLKYISELDIPIKRGTFIEFRNGMVNVCPMGRNSSIQERNEFEKYDQIHEVRRKFVSVLREKFDNYGLVFSIGGQISFDVFPKGWDKTYCLKHVKDKGFKYIYFFGDKTYEGGNDWEIYNSPLTIGYSVKTPNDTARIVQELFFK